MIDPSDLFPQAIGNDISAIDALAGVTTKNELTDEQKKWWHKTPIGKAASSVHPKGHWFNFTKLSPRQVCGTVPKASGNAKFCYWDEPYGLSGDGYKRIGSFPDAYRFAGDYSDIKGRIGNSVPPLFMYAIASQISHVLFGTDKLNKKVMKNYPAHLENMWQKAIAPREPNAPTVISTFAGGGGSLTGYMMAGFNDLLAVEWDDNAVQTLRLNWPHLDIYHGDIAKLSVEEVLRRTGLQVGELDILDGSPPCQGFSTAGKRMMDDPRNQLFREYVRLLRGLRPKVFVMENVSGMVKGKMKLVFVEILKELKASGYRVSARLLNAKYFHVPQSRERMIFIGVRDDLGIEPSHPRAESGEITVGKVINGRAEYIPAPALHGKFGDLSKRLKQGQNISNITGTYGHGNQRISMSKPSPTIVKTAMFGSPKMMHPTEDRGLSVGEAARLGSFPDLYKFIGDYETAWQRIGNSVPPLMIEAIARHIRTDILSPTYPTSPHVG